VDGRILAEREKKAKTGVKGVLADYKAAMAMEAAQAVADAEQREAIIRRMVEGSKRAPDDVLVQAAQQVRDYPSIFKSGMLDRCITHQIDVRACYHAKGCAGQRRGRGRRVLCRVPEETIARLTRVIDEYGAAHMSTCTGNMLRYECVCPCVF
jgi:hypothetical protein